MLFRTNHQQVLVIFYKNKPNPTTNESDLVATSVNGDNTIQTAKNGSYSYEYLNTIHNFLWFNFVYLNKPNTTYTILLSTNSFGQKCLPNQC